MKARLLALVVDLLLDCFSLLIGPDKSLGIAVSTIPELAAAMLREDSGVAYVLAAENERRCLDAFTPRARGARGARPRRPSKNFGSAKEKCPDYAGHLRKLV
jgi:hypothetical protein